MPFQPPPRPLSVLASTLAAAGILLAAASCSHVTPLGPDSGGAPLAPARRLASPIVLELVASRPRPVSPPPGPARYEPCPAGFGVLTGPAADPRLCYRRLGQPAMISDASVTLAPDVIDPGRYVLDVTVRGAGQAALRAITTRADRHQLAILVAGRAWTIPTVITPITSGTFAIFELTRTQARDLLRLLGQPGR